MRNDDLISILRQIKTLVDHHSLKDSRRGSPPKAKESSSKSSGAKKLTGHILLLRDTGFFTQAKTAKDVHAKLQPTYSCDLNRVAVALLRLQRRKKLRKTSKLMGKKAQIAYVW
jgi:hypothetical protein